MCVCVLCPADLTEHHVNNSVLALVDGELWPLHQPLTRSCSLTLLTFKDNDPTMVNQVRPKLDLYVQAYEYTQDKGVTFSAVQPGVLAVLRRPAGPGAGDGVQRRLRRGAAQHT